MSSVSDQLYDIADEILVWATSPYEQGRLSPHDVPAALRAAVREMFRQFDVEMPTTFCECGATTERNRMPCEACAEAMRNDFDV